MVCFSIIIDSHIPRATSIGQQLVDLFPRLQFGQRLVGFFRQQPTDELQPLIGHQLGDQLGQRVVDEL